ncbi:ROK family transcriptional regulator [Bifidobacterium sp.]|uniref:ROK family transcriptional regulator n=1 Tax=Bifidobacterium sp. TaxID=41200 RepID=UPI0039E7B374
MAQNFPVLIDAQGPRRGSRAHRLASAAPADVRLRNRTAIMRALYPNNSHSRAELAKLTGMSKVSTSDVVADLIEDGLLVEGAYRTPHGPGKPSQLLQFNVSAGNVVSIDLSDVTRIRGVVVDLAGKVMHRVEIELSHAKCLDATEVTKLCQRLVDMCEEKVIGIAIATPGTVNDDGLILEAPNLGWVDMDFVERLRGVADCPVVVTNDADAAVFAEDYFGDGFSDMILVQIADGVGAGLLIDNNVVRGKGFTAGEIGHVVMSDGTRPCVCGKIGCLETIVSAPVLDRAIEEHPDDSERIIARAGKELGRALAMPVALTNITHVVFSGVPRLVNQTMVDAAQSTIDLLTRSRFLDAVQVQISTIGEDAAMLGAAGMVLRRVLAVM